MKFVKFLECEIRLCVARRVGKRVYFGVFLNALQLGSDSDYSIGYNITSGLTWSG